MESRFGPLIVRADDEGYRAPSAVVMLEFIEILSLNDRRDMPMSTVLTTQQSARDDGVPTGDVLYEMVNGKLVEKNVSAYAAWIALLLGRRLATYCDEHGLGTVTTELVFILDSKRRLRRRPDVGFVSPQKWPVDKPPPPSGDWELIPDIAIEVTSPHDSIAKVMSKTREYFRHGVTEVWIIIPEGQIVQVYRSVSNLTSFGPGDQISSEMIPGWSMPVVELLPHELEAETEDV